MVRFLNHDKLISLNTLKGLMNAGGPPNLYVRSFGRTKTKVQSLVIRREVASCGRGESDLAIDLNASTVAVSIAAFPAQRNCEPAQLPAPIQIQLRALAQRRSYHVHPAIVVQVAECRSPSGHGHIRSGVSLFETSLAIQCEQRRLPITQRAIVHLHIVENMALNNEDVLPAVVVKILQAYSPSRGFSGENAKPHFEFLRAERSPAIVMKNDVGLVRELGDEKVGQTIVIVILKDNSHA